MYKAYFYSKLWIDKKFLEDTLKLKGKRLGCYCKQPNEEVACHGDIIKEFLDNYDGFMLDCGRV
jgi:hypothetical protein